LQSTGKNVIIKHREYLFSRYIMPPKPEEYKDFLRNLSRNKNAFDPGVHGAILKITNLRPDATEQDKVNFLSELLVESCNAITSQETGDDDLKGIATTVIARFEKVAQDLMGQNKDRNPEKICGSSEEARKILTHYIDTSTINEDVKKSINDYINKNNVNVTLEARAQSQRQRDERGHRQRSQRPKPVSGPPGSQSPDASAISPSKQNGKSIVEHFSEQLNELESSEADYGEIFKDLANAYATEEHKEGLKLLQLIGKNENRANAATGPALDAILNKAVPHDENGKVIADQMDGEAIGTLIKTANKHPNSAFNEALKGFLAKEPATENTVVKKLKAKDVSSDDVTSFYNRAHINDFSSAYGRTLDQKPNGQRFRTDASVNSFLEKTADMLKADGVEYRKMDALSWYDLSLVTLLWKTGKWGFGNIGPAFARRSVKKSIYEQSSDADISPVSGELAAAFRRGDISAETTADALQKLSKRDGSRIGNDLTQSKSKLSFGFAKGSLIPINRTIHPSPAQEILEQVLSNEKVDDNDNTLVQELAKSMKNKSFSLLDFARGKGKLASLEDGFIRYIEKLAADLDVDKEDNLNKIKKTIDTLAGVDSTILFKVSATAAFAIARKPGKGFRDALDKVTNGSKLTLSQLKAIKDILAARLVNLKGKISQETDQDAKTKLQDEVNELRKAIDNLDRKRREQAKGIEILKSSKEQFFLAALLLIFGGPLGVIGLIMLADVGYKYISDSLTKFLNGPLGKIGDKGEILKLGYDAGLISTVVGLAVALFKGMELGLRKLFGGDVDLKDAVRFAVDVANGHHGLSILSLIEVLLTFALLPITGPATALYNYFNKSTEAAGQDVGKGQDAGKGQGVGKGQNADQSKAASAVAALENAAQPQPVADAVQPAQPQPQPAAGAAQPQPQPAAGADAAQSQPAAQPGPNVAQQPPAGADAAQPRPGQGAGSAAQPQPAAGGNQELREVRNKLQELTTPPPSPKGTRGQTEPQPSAQIPLGSPLPRPNAPNGRGGGGKDNTR
jgi:hypothetical protein